eukprot:15279236-Alexandrium_andersonii.AAC.1
MVTLGDVTLRGLARHNKANHGKARAYAPRASAGGGALLPLGPAQLRRALSSPPCPRSHDCPRQSGGATIASRCCSLDPSPSVTSRFRLGSREGRHSGLRLCGCPRQLRVLTVAAVGGVRPGVRGPSLPLGPRPALEAATVCAYACASTAAPGSRPKVAP